MVQCYVRNLGASLEQPVRSLEGFERVTLKPGESKQVSFKLGFPELSFYDNSGTRRDRADRLYGVGWWEFTGRGPRGISHCPVSAETSRARLYG